MAWDYDSDGNMVWFGDTDTGETQEDYTVNVGDTGIYQSEAETNRLNAAENEAYLESLDAWDPAALMESVGQASTDSTTDAAGNKTYTYPDGSTVTKDADGNVTGMTGSEASKSWSDILSALPARAAAAFKKMVVNPDNSLNLANIGTALAGVSMLGGSRAFKQAGYNVPVPELGMTRQQVMPTDPNRRPGSAGLQYFTDPKYTGLTDTVAQSAAGAADTTQAAGIRAARPANTAAAVNPWAGKMKPAFMTTPATNPMAAAPAEGEKPLAVPTATLPDWAIPKKDVVDQGYEVMNLPYKGGPDPTANLKSRALPEYEKLYEAPSAAMPMPQGPGQGNLMDVLAGGGAKSRGNPNYLDAPFMPVMGGTPTSTPEEIAQRQQELAEKVAANVGQPQAASGLAGMQAAEQAAKAASQGVNMAQGGLASFARGGNNYLRGGTDGMADKLDTTIDNKQAAKLSHGEFVIPADVVSHLGNGNSEAGADRLYDMMSKIRKARTGNPEQGKRINPDKFMPGGLAKYAAGGAIAFAAGDIVPASTSKTDVLSEWAGPAVSGMLSKGFAASNAPYQAYTGPLTAGASDLQQQAFAGASDLASTGYTPTQFTTGTFDTAAANKYLNPYINASLDPQLKELQRQSQISNMTNAGKLSQAGAYGGSRQAILQGEENRNLLDKSQDLIGTGYNTAYQKAMDQFNTEQGRGMDAQRASEASRVYGADYGLKSVQNLADLGATQRGITGEGITADKAQFEEQRDNPMLMAQYQKNLLTGLPVTTQNTNVNQSPFSQLLGSSSDLKRLQEALAGLGVTAGT